MGLSSTLDSARFSPFHRKLVVGCMGGPLLDGFMLSIIGIAMVGLTAQFGANELEVSLIGASALVGIFFGALFLGPLTDKIGRRLMYTIDLWALVIASALQFVVQDATQLIILRFIVGLAIGADYPIASALLAEWLPQKRRGKMLGMLITGWFAGAALASLVGFIMSEVFGPESWRWMLGSSAVLGIAVLAMRHGIPESPRWLLNNGRRKEAEDALRVGLGDQVDAAAVFAAEAQSPARTAAKGKVDFSLLLRRPYPKRLFFCSAFYILQVTPLFAIFTFGPVILSSFGLGQGNLANLGSVIINAVFLLGCLPALRLVETVGRRPLIIWSFALMALPLFVLGFAPGAPVAVIIACFCMYAFFSGGPNILEWAYPSELFPTEVRASAIGITTGASRIGAAIGTFVIPFALRDWGIGPTMLAAAGLTALGWLICVLMAEETKGMSLAAAAGGKETNPAAAKESRVDIASV
ncbi:MFS transporter [Paenarthrobacter nitroguajacolicus]|uniref:MFS transporter n=1 Tax=Paenarthrobacter nitroguajacolicus TaxID=211146 RepID=UPI0015B89819|nr:MFS transporter [Paenarthrobacter nitroguajacolicus]